MLLKLRDLYKGKQPFRESLRVRETLRFRACDARWSLADAYTPLSEEWDKSTILISAQALISGDALWGVETDEFDVDYMVRYDIVRG